jgi:nucleoside 2-deoxyribosyltransferase
MGSHHVLRISRLPSDKAARRSGLCAILGQVATTSEVHPKGVPEMRVYLSGPDVFFPNAIEVGQAKKEICARFGLEGVYPLDPDFSGLLVLKTPADMGYASFRLMVELMESCDLVIANMTPFRGPSMDVGTAVEMGYMYGRGKPVFGYTNVAADYAERVAPDGFAVEPFSLADNCMCEGPVHETGAVVVRHATPASEVYTSLDGFIECVRRATRLMSDKGQ